MEQALKEIGDFCVRRKRVITFDSAGDVWFEGRLYTATKLAAEIKKDDQRVCHEELVAGVRKFVHLEVGNKLEVGQHLAILLKASEACLSQQ